MRIAIVGAGYVGLTTAVALAYLGHEVYGVERDRGKVAAIRSGRSPIHEPGLDRLLRLSAQRLEFTDDMVEALQDVEVVILAVGTPPLSDGSVDLRYVENASLDIADALRDGGDCTFVIKSTVPIGTNVRVSSLVRKKLEERGVSAKVKFALNPEFLREGMAIHDTLYPDRIVVGAEDRQAIDTLRKMYYPVLDQSFDSPSFLPRPQEFSRPDWVETDPASATMIKYASNAYLATKISFANEIAGLCERVGADVLDVTRGMGLDGRIGHRFLGAGVGWGGSCFPKDTRGLLAMGQAHDYPMSIISAACDVNQRQRYVVIEKLESALGPLRGRTIGILGVSFKPNTDDVREAPALRIIDMLLERQAFVRVHDPVVPRSVVHHLTPGAEYVSDPYHLASGCDAMVLVTEWSEYQHLKLAELGRTMRTRVLVDGRNLYSRREAEAAGFQYYGIGR